MRYRIVGILLAAGLCLYSCSSPEPSAETLETTPLFLSVTSTESGIDFANMLVHTEQLNTYTYRNFYNGAGIAVGDINSDGLLDLYIAGNQVDNKLYLNKGDFTFEDITKTAGVACADVWSTGVSMADVNGDGLIDIYVCKSGPPEGPNRNNELFINNGDNTFSEQAKRYGIDDKGLSHHAVFLDYDLDGDLDMYLLNNSLRSVGIYDLREGQRDIRDPNGGNKLYRNDGVSFTDVSEEAGIYGSAIGFGLGVTASDLNKDGWPDIFVSNDFFERDYLYINQKDGTFVELLEEYMNEISMGSMGADIADLTNDGYPEIYVTEMLPESLERVKTKTVFEDWDKYQSNVKNGYYHQFTRNVFQLNNGPVPGNPSQVSFSEISRLTGTEATDWSWGALLFDVDNNGHKDIFVANGIYKDLTDQDYINFYSNTEMQLSKVRRDSNMLTSLIDKIPSEPLDNHLYLNQGDLSFKDAMEGSGMEGPGFSNGAAYADLDNDGDLDLVINNINAPLSVFRNLSAEQRRGNSVQIELEGPAANSAAFGSQIYAYAKGETYFVEQQPVKGYMSTMDPRIHIGIGAHTTLDSLHIIWPDHSETSLFDIGANQLLHVSYDNAERKPAEIFKKKIVSPWLISSEIQGLDTVRHIENEFIDFNRDRLLFEMYSNEGPAGVSGDVNGDGLEDLLIGGSVGQPTRLYIQQQSGSFLPGRDNDFAEDARSEDTDLVLVDVDGDNDLDLLVASGGNEFSFGDSRWQDRLYLNDGEGHFTRVPEFIQNRRTSSAFILPLDYDLDGDQDLLIGGRLQPFNYGMPASSALLNNDGSGRFTEVTDAEAPALFEIGLLTDAVVLDNASGQRPSIVLVGEWMQPVLLTWKGGQYQRANLNAPAGLFKSAYLEDLNKDGFMDIVLGNFGENTRFEASPEKPLTMLVGDYDENGSIEHILSAYSGDSLTPLVLLQDLTKQMPVVRKKYQTFDAYKTATVREVLGDTSKGIRLEVTSLQSGVLWGGKDNAFTWKPFPLAGQIAPVYAIHCADFNADGKMDILLAGNQPNAKPELGIYNASFGTVLAGNGEKEFIKIPDSHSGIWMRGAVRNITSIQITGTNYLIVLRNNDKILTYRKP